MRLVFGKRPMMFYQGADSFYCRRVRILHPDGTSEFQFLDKSRDPCEDWEKPCWSPIWPTSQEDQFKRMKFYDNIYGFPPAEFLGYL